MESWIIPGLLVTNVFVLAIGFAMMNRKLNDLHASTNSRLDALLASTGKLARMEGYDAGREDRLQALSYATEQLKEEERRKEGK